MENNENKIKNLKVLKKVANTCVMPSVFATGISGAVTLASLVTPVPFKAAVFAYSASVLCFTGSLFASVKLDDKVEELEAVEIAKKFKKNYHREA